MNLILKTFSALALTAIAQTLQAANTNVEDYARLPAFSNPQLSPDGKRIAATITHEGKPLLITRNLDGSGQVSAIKLGELYLDEYLWANNERLVVGARSSFDAWGHEWNIVRLAAINHDGSDPIYLPMRRGRFGYIQFARVVDRLRNEPDNILAIIDYKENSWYPKLTKVNIYNGGKEPVERNNKEIHWWLTDYDGNVRLAWRFDHLSSSTDVRIWHKARNGRNFELIQKADSFDNQSMRPILFDRYNQNIMAYATDVGLGAITGDDDLMDSLLALDMQTGEQLGSYKDPFREQVLQSADSTFAGEYKLRIISKTDDESLATVLLYSDVMPARYFLYESHKDKFSFLGAAYPQLEKIPHTRMSETSYKARDDRTIPAYLTIPATAGSDSVSSKPPLIVMAHGGPIERDYWSFNNYVQFFASKGYAVFQPQFRGSKGFGVDHEEAGYYEWGKKIQDDISDGVEWLISEGKVDPERICILGTNLGAYAAAMGTIVTPDMYSCAVSINGVLNLPKQLQKYRYAYHSRIKKLVTRSQAKSTEISPYHRAKEIETPILLIATEDNTIVSVKQSRDMNKKLKRLKRNVEYIEFEGGEHWRTDEKIEVETLKAIEAFLEKHLG